MRLAFTPCLQYQYAAGKNTADIALAFDALEALLDARADTFCLVTSDSDFAYLCRKLRERGATVCIVGEAKTPDALGNASDEFFGWTRPTPEPKVACPAKTESKVEPPRPPAKRRPHIVVDAVALMVAGTNEGKVTLSALGGYLKRADPAFSPSAYGHSGMLNMFKTYDLLNAVQETGGHWSVSLAKDAGMDESSAPD